MKYLLFPIVLTILQPIVSAQTVLSSTLPACAQQCTLLQQANTGCTPAGGAPVADQGTYQSCFCQSALLPQLYSGDPVQLCTSCSATDMATIQSWYKGLCANGAPVANAQQPSSTSSSRTSSATASSTVAPQAAASVTNPHDSNASNQNQNNANKPWMTTHWKWVIMLIVLFFGLAALAFLFWFLHRRYHRRREAQWSGSQPNINTWGPGQSVHDLNVVNMGSAVSQNEKGKARAGTYRVQEPTPPAPMGDTRRGKRLSRNIF